MSDTDIEKGVPIGPPRGVTKSALLDLRKMQPGDSIVRPKQDRNLFYIAAKRIGVGVVTRELGDGTIRVWMTEAPI